MIKLIYCVEDDKNIRELIIYTLKAVGFEAVGLCDYKELNNQMLQKQPEMILLDLMLPEKDGLQILKELKSDIKTKNIPVIMLTAKGSEFDKVIGLDTGADDYIAKPFGTMEMVSRIKAVLRRYESLINENDIIKYDNIVLDKKKYTVLVETKEIALSFKEYGLLKIMLENQGLVLTRDQLLNKVWGYDYDGENRTVDVHIRALRQKLGEKSDIIQTIRNVGYKIGT